MDLRVLLIEDSASDAELIAHELDRCECPVTYELVDTALDTRKKLNENRWDVILCDYSMPNLDPYKVLEILRENQLDIPFIVISGKIGEEEAIKLLKAGCHDCLIKNDLRRLPNVIMREIKEAVSREENRVMYKKLQKYQILCDAVNDIMIFMDAAGNILDVNPAALRCYGYSFAEFLTKNILDLLHPSDMESERAQMETAIASGIVYDAIHYRKNNTSFFAEVSSKGVLLNGQNMILSIIRDITERKQNEVQRERYLKDLLESQRAAHIGTWRLDVATNQVVWSDELYKMYGFDPSLPPPHYTEQMNLFTPECWARLSTSLERTRKLGIPYELELKTVNTNGSNGWMWVRGEAEKDLAGNIIALWGASQDITEFMKLENERLKFFLLAESSSEFIGMCDLDMNPTYVNPAGRSMVGLPDMAAACRVKVQDYFFPEDQRFIAEEFSPRVLRDGRGDVEIRMRHFQTGEAIWIFYYLFAVLNESGKPIGWATVSHDITARKKTEEALRRSEEKFRVVQEISPDGFTILTPLRNEAGEIIDFAWVYENQAIARINQTVPEKVIGKKLLDLFPDHSGTSVFEAYKHVAATKETKILEVNVGEVISRPTWLRIVVVSMGEDIAILAQDITERKTSEENLGYLSNHDYLTGLYNRRFFEEEIKKLDVEANLPLSVIMLDTNGLKIINDSFGHKTGDELLIKVARIVKQACRTEDLIVRYGGDEFVVVLPKTSDAETLKVANTIKELTLKEKVENIELSLSYGYTTKYSAHESIQEKIANAENYMYSHKLAERSSMRSKTIEIIMNTLFEKSHREAQHSARVSKICEAIADKMQFEKQKVSEMRIVGLVHDIGKISISENILNKPGSLDSYEWKEMEKHPESGWRILSSSDELAKLAKHILHHHERWDGHGYPNKLAGEQIPLESRIITIADAYDAMTSLRSYKIAMSHEEAIKEILRCSGTQFDPAIVEVFATLPNSAVDSFKIDSIKL